MSIASRSLTNRNFHTEQTRENENTLDYETGKRPKGNLDNFSCRYWFSTVSSIDGVQFKKLWDGRNYYLLVCLPTSESQ